jgi:hypothetical protein
MFCRERAARFHALRADLEPAALSFIGNGLLGMAQDFAEQFHVTEPLYTDPARASYAALGLQRKFGLGLKSLARGKRASAAGFRQGKVQGDPWQQGGVVLFDREGGVLWKHVDDGAGHAVDEAGLVAAVRAM